MAIRSAGLWCDADAAEALSDALTSQDAHIARLAAMALGRIGDRSKKSALLEAGKGELDPFLKHAITYSLFEMGVAGSVAESHPLGTQLRKMDEVAKSRPNPNLRPDIAQADPVEMDGVKVARQYTRMGELRSHFIKEGEIRNEGRSSSPIPLTCALPAIAWAIWERTLVRN